MELKVLVVFQVWWCACSAKTACSDLEDCLSSDFVSSLKEVLNTDRLEILPGVLELRRNPLIDTKVVTDLEDRGTERRVISMVWDGLLTLLHSHTVTFKLPLEMADVETARQSYIKLRRFLLPLLLGVTLKLAAFVPLALSLLALLGKSAFLSGNAALFLSGLTIFLRYFYPKTGQTHFVKQVHSSQHNGYEVPEPFHQHHDFGKP